MATIKIIRTYDDYDCDQCSGASAEGAIIYIDNKKVLDLEPMAHCYDGTTYNDEDILKAVLHYLNYEVEITHEA